MQVDDRAGIVQQSENHPSAAQEIRNIFGMLKDV